MQKKWLQRLKGKEFKVDPMSIDKNLFLTKRRDRRQEWMRLFILKALDEMERNPERYRKIFWVMIPKKCWISKTVKELVEIASTLGDHITNGVEQALVWAQRIANGETWDAVCNNEDTEDWFRLIEWMDGTYRVVGGSNFSKLGLAASNVRKYAYNLEEILLYTVPLVTKYKKSIISPEDEYEERIVA